MERRPAELQLPALTARAQLGDHEALDKLLRNLQEPLHEHIRGIVRNDDVAADVLQETLVTICRRLGTVRELAWIRAWAYRVATRRAVRAVRRERRSPLESLDFVPELAAGAQDESHFDPETLAVVARELDALPQAAQLVVRMRYLQELSQAEIAEALEIPLGTVKSRLAYGLSVLRRGVTTAR